jgi:beta-phosphoglucomutase-like phosphatase (HAD superfamily)
MTLDRTWNRHVGPAVLEPSNDPWGRIGRVKNYLLFDHDGVLVDTESWYYRAAERAFAQLGLTLDPEQYQRDMVAGAGSWAQARATGVAESVIDRLRAARDAYYREYLQTEDIEIPGVLDVLAELSAHVRMAIVTTSKRTDVELIHRARRITAHMDFVLTREDYAQAKPHPEPYLTGLHHFGARKDEVPGLARHTT